MVAVFASQHAARIQERNVFSVVPLFVIALLAWLERGAPRPRLARDRRGDRVRAARPRDPVPALHQHARRSPTRSCCCRGGRCSTRPGSSGSPRSSSRCRGRFAALFLLVPRRYALVLPLARPRVLGRRVQADLVRLVPGSGRRRSARSSRASAASPRDWIDAAVPQRRGRRRALDGTRRPVDRQPERVLQPRRRARLLHRRADARAGIGETSGRVDPRPASSADGRALPGRRSFLITDGSIEPDGKSSRATSCSAWRSGGPTARWSRPTSVTGLYPDDTWSGPRVT